LKPQLGGSASLCHRFRRLSLPQIQTASLRCHGRQRLVTGLADLGHLPALTQVSITAFRGCIQAGAPSCRSLSSLQHLTKFEMTPQGALDHMVSLLPASHSEAWIGATCHYTHSSLSVKYCPPILFQSCCVLEHRPRAGHPDHSLHDNDEACKGACANMHSSLVVCMTRVINRHIRVRSLGQCVTDAKLQPSCEALPFPPYEDVLAYTAPELAHAILYPFTTGVLLEPSAWACNVPNMLSSWQC
jgi:hypothetical protein